jgi:hypothetical protein
LFSLPLGEASCHADWLLAKNVPAEIFDSQPPTAQTLYDSLNLIHDFCSAISCASDYFVVTYSTHHRYWITPVQNRRFNPREIGLTVSRAGFFKKYLDWSYEVYFFLQKDKEIFFIFLIFNF